MDFETLLAQMRNPGEDGIPDSIYDDLSASYTDATSTRDAKIESTMTSTAALQAELLAAKAANWDLLQMIPQATPDAAPTDGAEDDNIGENDAEDDFFTDKDDK